MKNNHICLIFFCCSFSTISAQNCIHYTTIDDVRLELNDSEAIDGNIINHVYENGLGTITFDRGITSIGNHCFAESGINTYYDPKNDDEVTIIGNSPYPDPNERHYLESITLPEGLTSIGKSAFQNCIYMKSIGLPSSLANIGEYAFANDTLLTTLGRPFPQQPVFNYTFSDCRALESIDLSNVTDSIGHRAFQRCLSLKNVIVPEGVTHIADSAFYYCGATSLVLPSSLKTIGTYAFCGMPITGVTIPENLEELTFFCFGFTHLTSCKIPSTIKKIPVSCFEACYFLESIDFPIGLEEIGTYAFANCSSLHEINYEGTMEQWERIIKNNDWYKGGWHPTPLSVVHCSDGDVQITPRLLSQEATRINYFLHMSESEWATCCFPFALFGTPQGLTVYKVNSVNLQSGVLNMQKTAGAAHKPYLVCGKPGYYIMSGKWYDTPQPSNLSNGMLVGTYEDLELDTSSAFVLQNHNGDVGFYQVDENNPITLPAYKAYLNCPDAQASSFRLTGEDQAEDLLQIKDKKEIRSIYNLEGEKITEIRKGINIIEYDDNTRETILYIK